MKIKFEKIHRKNAKQWHKTQFKNKICIYANDAYFEYETELTNNLRNRVNKFFLSIIEKWFKMNEFCSNKIINDFEWFIIAHIKLAKINNELFLFVKELSALACGFLALRKWQINWNDENWVARPTKQDFTQRLLG